MSQPGYDVAVVWRIYPKVSTASARPAVFAEDKLQLAEFCFQSFKNSVGNLRVKLWVALNGCPPEFDAMVTRVWGPDLTIVHFPNVSAAISLNESSRLLAGQTDAEIVFLACDDYFYLPGQFEQAVAFLKQNPDADFVTIYDHLDLYTTDLHKLPCETRDFGGKNWISCISTTDSYMTRRKILNELRDFYWRLRCEFSNAHSPDLASWMALTKRRVFNPFKFVQWGFMRPYWAVSILLAWRYCWRQILFGRCYTLWGPRPSIATHMVTGLESPGIDWRKEFEKQLAVYPIPGKTPASP